LGDNGAVLVAGLAGLMPGAMSGAMSMAAGEYVTVSFQADTEAADPVQGYFSSPVSPVIAAHADGVRRD